MLMKDRESPAAKSRPGYMPACRRPERSCNRLARVIMILI